jgi:hypothetical protein
MIWSISCAIASRASAGAVSDEPSSTSSPARRMASVMSESAISALSCQPCASLMLRWYCWVASIEVRSAIARDVL